MHPAANQEVIDSLNYLRSQVLSIDSHIPSCFHYKYLEHRYFQREVDGMLSRRLDFHRSKPSTIQRTVFAQYENNGCMVRCTESSEPD